MWTFPPASLYSFLSFLYQRPQLPWKELSPPKQDFWKVSFWMLINSMGLDWTHVGQVHWGNLPSFLWEHNMPDSNTIVDLGIPWPHTYPSGFSKAQACKSTCWMVGMRPTCGPVSVYKGPSSHIWIAVSPQRLNNICCIHLLIVLIVYCYPSLARI